MPIKFQAVKADALKAKIVRTREAKVLADEFIADMASLLSDDVPALLTEVEYQAADPDRVDWDRSQGITLAMMRATGEDSIVEGKDYNDLADALEAGKKYSLDSIVRWTNLDRDKGGIGGKLDVYAQRIGAKEGQPFSGSLVFKRYSALKAKPKEEEAAPETGVQTEEEDSK